MTSCNTFGGGEGLAVSNPGYIVFMQLESPKHWWYCIVYAPSKASSPVDKLVSLRSTSTLTRSTSSCLPHCLKALASLLYVAAGPCLFLHVVSIVLLCTGTELGEYPIMFSSSVCVSPRTGAISLQSWINCDISTKSESRHGKSNDTKDKLWWSAAIFGSDRPHPSREGLYYTKIFLRKWSSVAIMKKLEWLYML